MKLLVEFDCCAQILDVPKYILENRDDLHDQFLDWIYDKNNDHDYWERSADGRKIALCYDSEAFAAWLNQFVLKPGEQKAVYIGDCPFENPENLPSIFF